MSQTYDVHYFINKFKAIPEDLWHAGSYHGDTCGQGCALYHCGETARSNTDESTALNDLFRHQLDLSAALVNDGEEARYPQPTPRARILAALHDIAAMQAVPVDTLMAECLANIETKGGPY